MKGTIWVTSQWMGGQHRCVLWGEELGSRRKAIPPSSSWKESVPVSSYQQAGIPADLKRKIARLGINMLLKMVS